MADVGGRVREGRTLPYELCTNFGHDLKDAGHRGGGFRWLRRHSADPLGDKCLLGGWRDVGNDNGYAFDFDVVFDDAHDV